LGLVGATLGPLLFGIAVGKVSLGLRVLPPVIVSRDVIEVRAEDADFSYYELSDCPGFPFRFVLLGHPTS
jgi:hypothetical protein